MKLPKKLKKLRVASKKRSKKNWPWFADINPDGTWKATKRKVRTRTPKNSKNPYSIA